MNGNHLGHQLLLDGADQFHFRLLGLRKRQGQKSATEDTNILLQESGKWQLLAAITSVENVATITLNTGLRLQLVTDSPQSMRAEEGQRGEMLTSCYQISPL